MRSSRFLFIIRRPYDDGWRSRSYLFDLDNSAHVELLQLWYQWINDGGLDWRQELCIINLPAEYVLDNQALMLEQLNLDDRLGVLAHARRTAPRSSYYIWP
jgi:hypothetical protein